MSSFLRHFFADHELRAQRKLCASIGEFLDLLERAPLAPDPDTRLRDGSALQRVDRLCAVAREAAPAVRHPICALLQALLVDAAPYQAEIDIRSITAISASKGGRVDALDALPETIRSLYPPTYSFGPYDDAGMKILIEAVFAEFFPDGMRDRHFVVRDAPWCGERIAANSGASRRFALWRRLAGWPGTPRRIQARIRETGLNREALAAIQRQWRVVWAIGAPDVRRAVADLGTHWPSGPTFLSRCPPSANDATGFWCVPLPHGVPPQLQERLAAIHARLDLAGVEDPLRELVGGISRAARTPPRDARDEDRAYHAG
ncbi:hypothetical protein HLH33_19120 [Gluconacetobacter diazotrophicus]|uniref:Uncharacterized protein n=1 Tax=Gluconacetobacter diazotrophicus TaxID=33996 RepID=A0A7W4I8V7_GLUDI|nr:hypothetical protein [Gluconacetobacter diazotrophicus]MBB2158374.1 hypothetical protein [Gluconacetobacter diazotrophicus]